MSNQNIPQPIETIPEDRSELFAKIQFTSNKGDRKSPSQSAGELHERFANLPQSKDLLFSTSFKGNDGNWWKLIDRVGSWAWIVDKSVSIPKKSTSTQSIDDRIDEDLFLFQNNDKKIKYLPPYLKELALRNQVKQGNKSNDEINVSYAFSEGNFNWEKSTEGEQFWVLVYEGNWTSDEVLQIVGSKEKLFELPPAQSQPTTQPTTPSNKNDIGPIIGVEPVKFNTGGSELASMAFQLLVFQLGCEWGSGGKQVKHKDAPFLFIDKNKVITKGTTQSFFNTDPSKEITIEQLKAQVTLKTTSNSMLGPDVTKEDVKFDSGGDKALFQEFQELIFQFGFAWGKFIVGGGGQTIYDFDGPYIFTKKDENLIVWSEHEDTFNTKTNKQITIEQLRAQVARLKSAVNIDDLAEELVKKMFLDISSDNIFYINNQTKTGDNEITFGFARLENKNYYGPQDADGYVTFNSEQITNLLSGEVTDGYRVLTDKEIQPFGKGTDISIDDFLYLNNPLITTMKQTTPEVFDAFTDIMNELVKKYPSNVKSQIKVVMPEPLKKEPNTFDDLVKFSKSMSIEERIKEAVKKFVEESTYANLPPYLKELALRNQENQGNPRNENMSIFDNAKTGGFNLSDSIEGKYFWEAIALGNWTMDVVMNQIPGTLETLFEMPAPVSSQQSRPVKTKEWTPQDLVGKFILDINKNKIYEVTKLSRNNPKNKTYDLRDVETKALIGWGIPMGAINNFLDGKIVSKKYKLVDDPKKTTTPEPTKIKDPNDYSTWSQAELVQKLEEIKEALQYLDEEDDEYIDLKAKMNTIELFID